MPRRYLADGRNRGRSALTGAPSARDHEGDGAGRGWALGGDVVTSRPNRILAAVLAGIAVLTVAAGVLAANRHVAEFDPGTPETAVQAYLTAVVDGDNERAASLLAADGSCGLDDLDRSYVPDGVRAVLRDSEVNGDTARVDVGVEMSTADLFAGSGYTEKHTFRLVRHGEGWLITGVPWPMYDCTKEG